MWSLRIKLFWYLRNLRPLLATFFTFSVLPRPVWVPLLHLTLQMSGHEHTPSSVFFPLEYMLLLCVCVLHTHRHTVYIFWIMLPICSQKFFVFFFFLEMVLFYSNSWPFLSAVGFPRARNKKPKGGLRVHGCTFFLFWFISISLIISHGQLSFWTKTLPWFGPFQLG